METPYDVIRVKCAEKLISVRKLELALGFSNGYLKTLDKPMTNYIRAKQIADFLGIPVDALTGHPEVLTEPKKESDDFYDQISEQYGSGATEAVRFLLSLDSEDRAEIRGEMRQMLRLEKYKEKIEELQRV